MVMPTYYQYLAHHGVLGQKWGKRNGPPYPLGVGDHSASEKKAGWQKSLDNSSKEANNKSQSKDNKATKKGLTDKQKRALKIGVAVAATVLATYGLYKLNQSGKLDDFKDFGKDKADRILGNSEFGQQKIKDLSGYKMAQEAVVETIGGIKKLAKPELMFDTLKNVNPNRGDTAYKNNCTLCSLAFILRRHRYDVRASNKGGDGQMLGGLIEECFKGAKVFDGSAVKFGRSPQDAAEMLLKRFGNNAEGVCGIDWKNGGGHAFNWIIKDGVVSFFDGQNAKDDSFVSRYYWNLINPDGHLTFARLDNVEINFDAIKKWLE